MNPASNSRIRNNTIVYNINEGIYRTGGSFPNVLNNILYYNNEDEAQLAGMNLEQIYYCCVPDCNDVNNQHNIKDPPVFAYSYPVYGYFHLNWDSPCRDAGDPDEQNYVGIGEVDMDKDDRAGDGTVDIGADEVACEYYTSDPNDWNGDGVINYGEFLFLSRAWLSRDPNDPAIITDPNYSEDPDYADPETLARWEQTWFPWGKTSDMDHDLTIDLADLELFLDNWLWKACWWENYIAVWSKMGGGSKGSMMMSMPMMESVQETQMAETKSIEEQILDLEEAIEFLEKIWMEDPYIQQEIDEESWKEFMDAVYSSLYELKT